MSEETEVPQSQLFTVRIWLGNSDQMRTGWHGKVQHVPSGAWQYFREWESLTEFIEAQINQENVIDRSIEDLL